MATHGAPLISQPPINFTHSEMGLIPNLPDGVSVAVNLPSFIVPARATVRLAPRVTNAHPISVAQNFGDLGGPREIFVLQGQYLLYPVTNLNKIWVRVHTGESVDVTVTAPAIEV